MSATLKLEVRPEEIIQAIKGMKKKQRESFLEDLFALTAPEYLESIREARGDYKAKRVKNHDEVFRR